MRLALGKLKTFVYLLIASVLFLGCVVCFRAANVSRFSVWEGRRTFFLDSASSQSLIKTELSIFDVFRIKGESVQISIEEYDGGKYANKKNIDGQVRDEIAQAIAEEYGAYPLFKESVCGIDSYYFYSLELPFGIELNGKKVNLHVAVAEDYVAIGTPIIFGGF